MGGAGALGAFSGAAVLVHDLDSGHHVGWLDFPRGVGQEARVHENRLEFGHFVIEGHLLQVRPILRRELGDRFSVDLLEIPRIAGQMVEQQTPLVIAEEADRLRLARQGERAVAVGAVVDEIAEHHNSIVRPGGDLFQQFGEFVAAAVHVSDGNVAVEVQKKECSTRFQPFFLLDASRKRVKGILRAEVQGCENGAFGLKVNSMVWQIKAFSHRCCVSGNPLEVGEYYVSYLVIDENNELQRFDVSAANDEAFEPQGELLCRWRQVYKQEPVQDDAARKQKETAEGLFISLFEEETEEAPEEEREKLAQEREIMKKFLAVMLERKRVLRPRGESPDGACRLMEHVRSKSIYPVPSGVLAQEELMRISEWINSLVGGGAKKTTKPATGSEGADDQNPENGTRENEGGPQEHEGGSDESESPKEGEGDEREATVEERQEPGEGTSESEADEQEVKEGSEV